MTVVTIQLLREELPEWHWQAVRVGPGWRYEGRLDDRRVTIRAEDVPISECGDLSKRMWIVYDTGESYATWYCRESIRLSASRYREEDLP